MDGHRQNKSRTIWIWNKQIQHFIFNLYISGLVLNKPKRKFAFIIIGHVCQSNNSNKLNLMEMDQQHQYSSESPGGALEHGDHIDSPENSGGAIATPNQFLLGSEESAMNAAPTVGLTGPSATDLQTSQHAPITGMAGTHVGTYQTNQNLTQSSPQSYSAGGETVATFWGAQDGVNTETQYSPSRASAEDLTRMSGPGLANYLEQLRLPVESIGIVLNNCSDGQEWINLINEASGPGMDSGRAFMQTELKITSMITIVKLIADVKRALVWEASALEDKEHRKAIERQRLTRNIHNEAQTTQPDPGERARAGETPRVYHAPKLPEYDPRADQGAGADALQMFGKSLSGWIEGYDSEMADMITTVLERAGTESVDTLINRMTEKSRKLDTQLGAHLFSTASTETQKEMFEDKSRKFEGRTNCLVLLSVWLDHVDSNSKKRIARKLSEWLQRKPTEDPARLHDDLNQLKRDMGGMSRMGAWTRNDQIFASLIESTIPSPSSAKTRNS